MLYFWGNFPFYVLDPRALVLWLSFLQICHFLFSLSTAAFSSSTFALLLVLAVRRGRHLLQALNVPGKLLLWARTILAALVMVSLLLACCFIKFFHICPTQPSISSGDRTLSVSVTWQHQGERNGALKCQWSASLPPYLLLGWKLLPVPRWLGTHLAWPPWLPLL